jgi:hydroxymethylpyrimidine pyrophosphatase-like HAD family hydrolase
MRSFKYERFEIIKTRNNLLEFMPKGITKAYGISLLAKDLGIRAEEIMTLGDAHKKRLEFP